jgi:uncharacterized repeat protein (TIGR03806 family)
MNSPLWTDGIVKKRFLAVPPGQNIGFTADGAWDFPTGTVLIKAFILEPEAGNPETRRSVETRIMVKAADEWEFYSYKWNDEGTDGYLNDKPLAVEYAVRDGDTTTVITFEYPSHDGCMTCHPGVAGVAIGPRTMQLNRVINYEDGRRNQLAAMAAIGLFREPLPAAPESMPAMVAPADESAPIDLRARSYLHANCSHCHQPGGWNSTLIDIDFRYEVALADTKTCGVPISHTIHRRDGEYVLDPGNPENSNAYGRMTGSGISKMPPLGRSITDPLGAELVRDWIAGMTTCP